MSRAIRFRAWDGKKMVIWPTEMESLFGFRSLRNAGYEWMQFTGLTDKNGKEIYEGDVLEYEDDGMITDSGIYRVGWDSYHAGWGLWGEFDDDYSATVAGEVMLLSEVIGNIYENSDLLV